ncbi:hypothetical protein GE09DRAFT_539178 [Coniochaeta sp. 2T2.1]|nr:hypothetical protein GE09DRAFT_539178 [Coniochaeta sp. 2T2.1]
MATLFPSPTSAWHTKRYPSISPTRPELSAKGKTVLITGGGTGIGAETARSFAEAGASRIALLGRREGPLLSTKASIERDFTNTEIFVSSTDVTIKSAVDVAFSAFLGHGKLDVLVSGAALTGTQDPVSAVEGTKFLEVLEQNVSGALFVAQAFLRYASTTAVAINISSNAAHVNWSPNFAAYSTAKLAVFRLWDSVASSHPNLSIFHVQPGVVDTDMNREAGGIKGVGAEDHVSLPACFNVWLASPEARFLKGRFLWANWDVDELKARQREIETGTQFTIGLVGWPFDKVDWKPTWKN